jgi:hypothetical protein
MSDRFRVLSITEAKEMNLSISEYNDWDDYGFDDEDWFCGIWEFDEFGNAIRCVTVDTNGDCPEDAFLRRDNAWIAPALNRAYEQGFADGAGDGR